MMMSVDYISSAVVPLGPGEATLYGARKDLHPVCVYCLWHSCSATLFVSFLGCCWRVLHCIEASAVEVREAKAGTKRKAWSIVGLVIERLIGQ